MQKFLKIYDIAISRCKTDGAEGSVVFGIMNRKEGYVIEDISANRDDVKYLIQLLNNDNISKIQLLYIIQDFVASL